MNWRLVVMTIMVAGTIPFSVDAGAADLGRPNVIVRAYLTAPVRHADWQSAMRDVVAILDEAGMDVDSLTCSTDGTAVSTRCAEPLKSNEVTLRIVRANTPLRRATSELGESLLDPSRRSGTLATIFFDRVEWLARSADVPAGTVLARAIAHELGHLLLGATGHSRDGLMRAVWTRDELRRDRTRDWRFAPADAARLRAGVARREPIDTLVWATE